MEIHVAFPYLGLIPRLCFSSCYNKILLFAFASLEIGSPEILDAFTAGIAFSRRFTIPFVVAFQADKTISYITKS